MTMRRVETPVPRGDSSLVRCLIDLANTPDDAADLEEQLAAVVPLVTGRVDAADCASITVQRDGAYVTVATSGDVACAVDEAQYDSGGGPCLDSVATGAP